MYRYDYLFAQSNVHTLMILRAEPLSWWIRFRKGGNFFLCVGFYVATLHMVPILCCNSSYALR